MFYAKTQILLLRLSFGQELMCACVYISDSALAGLGIS